MLCAWRKRSNLAFLLAVLALFVLASPVLGGTFEDLENEVVEKVLPNGLKVILLPRPVAPVVSMATYANVGSSDEHTGITGLAHIFEHMAFKGTESIGTKDYKKEEEAIRKVDQAFLALKAERNKRHLASPEKLEKLEQAFKQAQDEAAEYVVSNQLGEVLEKQGAAGLNAYTSFDQTVYHYSLPSNKLELWAAVEADRFTNPVLREFYKETSVIREERRMGIESSPNGKLFEEALAAAYKAHPYHVLVIGHMSDLESITREEARAWFRKYYCGSNLTACVVGDVNPKTAMSLLEKHLARIPSGERPVPVETVEPAQLGLKRINVEDPAQPFLAMAYHKPDANDPDNATYEVITTLMGQGRTSRLYKRLVKEDKLALAAGCMSLGEKYPGLFIYFALPNKDKTTAENEAVILEEIERLKTEPVSEDELNGVKTRKKAEFINSLDSNMGLAINLANFENLTGSWRNMFRQLEQIESVAAEDIQRVAKKCFVKKNCTIAEIVKPESE
ncbi:MAG: insulinase family protein [Candidatus Eiseniibacteriota bacterium]|nr:MAG: insulinase family protein [Candidatus Eisenbacteria bacterium]